MENGREKRDTFGRNISGRDETVSRMRNAARRKGEESE